ncbi:lysoplasmalogenase-like protein TMEM86A [Elysia marginata]|uniref:lysoplasmalogenase n=1 Tax=Elysia marginata TaxID=1093978 RepID=A0AAV4EI04_9GAST|nr:lysoplasmalogenase-like protein TMEM86A [Elysia marginata]
MLDPALLPFFFLLLLYVVTFTPHLGRAPEAWTSVVLKILPVWYLAVHVVFKNYGQKRNQNKTDGINEASSGKDHRNGSVATDGIQQAKNPHLRKINTIGFGHDENDRASSNFSDRGSHLSDNELPSKIRFVIGLLISSIGDACLVYKALFKVGIVAFGVAQMMYLLALKHRYRRSLLAWVAVPLCITLNAILAPGIDEVILNILVFGYSLLIHSMLFYAIAGFESFPTRKSFSSMIGASLFIASDFLIALNKWVTITPYPEASILMTYYTAQLLLTIGIC